MGVASGRERIGLDGRWELAFDPENRGKEEGWAEGRFPATAYSVVVPGVWNTVRPGYEGVAFYRRRFEAPAAWRGRRVHLVVDAANYFAEFWLNSSHAGSHEGGYTPFRLDVTDLLAYGATNTLIARVIAPPLEGSVDGFRLAEIACAKETWYYRYGGLWASLALEASGRLRCADLFLRPNADGLSAVMATIAIANDDPLAQSVSLSLSIHDAQDKLVARTQCELAVAAGHGEATLSLELPRAVPWSVERPYLYRCRLALRDTASGRTLDISSHSFGLRSFDVAAGQFQLNGRPIRLRGVLYQPSYPVQLVSPPSPDWPGRELRLIKQAGFNLVRFHLRPPHPSYLALADRLGLLVYEETALGWIGEGPRLLARARREVRETILRDRNHPSVVLWGIFNENESAARAVGETLLSYAHALDPTRPAIDNSGGTAAIDQDGSWSAETRVFPSAADRPQPLNDLHLYFGAPVAPAVDRWLRRVGGDRRPGLLHRFGYATPAIVRALYPRLTRDGKLFVSELGYGGLPRLNEVAAAFGEDSPLVDAVEARAFRDGLNKGLRERGLDRTFGGVDRLIAATQALQAQGDARQVSALRCNPHVGGYVLTQFNDAAWEFHAGLVDLWRNPKRALRALAWANRPRRLVLFPERHAVAPGEQVRIDLSFIDERSPSRQGSGREEERDMRSIGHLTGPDCLRLVLGREGNALWRTERPIVLAGSGPIFPLPSVSIPAPPRPGQYRLSATLLRDGQEQAQEEESLMVLPPVDRQVFQAAVAGHVALASPDVRVSRLLGPLPVGHAADRPVLFASRPDALSRAAWVGLLEWVGQGGRALISALTPGSARRLAKAATILSGADGQREAVWLAEGRQASERSSNLLSIAKVQAWPSIGLFVGCYHYVKHGAVFRDLPAGGLADERYATVIPHYSLNELGGEVFAGAFTSRREAADGQPAFLWYADVQALRFGRGRLIFCQYRLVERLGRDPVADLLLRNLLELLVGRGETNAPDSAGEGDRAEVGLPRSAPLP